MPRKALPRVKRPSGIEVSANGKYYYWKCNVSGLETFAPEDRFKEVVAKFGGEDKLFQTYVLRPVQKMLNNGFSVESIKDIIKANKGKLPKKNAEEKERKKAIKAAKKPRKKGLKQFAVGEVKVVETTASGSVEEVTQKVYLWTGNPDSFKGTPIPLCIADETKNSCLYPNKYLDDQCYGCSAYAECQSPLKISEADRRSNKHRREAPKVTPINVFADEQ